MWETITPADIQRAKATWLQTRDRILERHQTEIKALEMDANLLRGLEAGCHAFHQRFIVPRLGNGNGPVPSIAPAKEAPTIEQSPDGKPTVIELPVSPKRPGDLGPNFGQA